MRVTLSTQEIHIFPFCYQVFPQKEFHSTENKHFNPLRKKLTWITEPRPTYFQTKNTNRKNKNVTR